MSIARLREYRAKRNFRRTKEPAGKSSLNKTSKTFFVVQKHDATRLHYDFRLAMAGVLKSWAVPKGFPVTRGDRRLAVEVEDHPMDYAQFEGTIPEGSYGAGTVMVWDIGDYEVHGDSPERALADGKLHMTLKGKKLKGDWTLVRMRSRESEQKPQWLLLKSGEDMSPISSRAEDQSVLTKRSLKQIASDNNAQWQSDRLTEREEQRRRLLPNRRMRRSNSRSLKPASPPSSRPTRKPVVPELGKLPKRKAGFVEPMKALLSENLPRGDRWTYELKFDGVRALAIKRGDSVKLLSRNEKDFTARFPEVVAALKDLKCDEVVLDGEVVALDESGRSSFQLLQSADLPGQSKPPIFYYVFDVIALDGRDLTGLPLARRKAIARELVTTLPDSVRFSAGIQADSEKILREMKSRGLEGLIAKSRDSKYEIGRRSGAWVKFKWTNEQEFVIGGYTSPKGARSHFGAILVGYHEGKKLVFASKVGTGFSEKILKSLYGKFQKLIRKDCPFANLPERDPSRWGRALTASEMKRCTWIEPKLVCQIRFAEWTRDNHLRQPAFLGLREDKKPKEVVRERQRSVATDDHR